MASKEEIIGLIATSARIHLEEARKTDTTTVARLVNASQSVALFRMLMILYPKNPSLWREGLQEAKDIKERLVEEISLSQRGAV